MINILTLCIIISAASLFFIQSTTWIGPLLIVLALLCLLSLTIFKIRLATVIPDLIFGLIDNGILAIMAVFGGRFAGVVGAILGGVVGNAVTDGIAGIFEGYYAQKMRNQAIAEERTMLKSAVGKMAGCLLGAGSVLSIVTLLT